jgi:hypothetical protein
MEAKFDLKKVDPGKGVEEGRMSRELLRDTGMQLDRRITSSLDRPGTEPHIC